jgi:hypothetical protein
VRIANTLVTGVLFTAVVGEGAYIIKTQRQVTALTSQVQQLTGEAAGDDESPVATRSGGGSSWVGESRTAPANAPSRLPVPRFNPAPPEAAPSGPGTTSAGTTPLPPVLDTPEARTQLRNFVAAELQAQRENMREQARQARDEEIQRRMENTFKTLGISPEQGAKVTQVLAQGDESRRQVREKVQSGQLTRADVGKELQTLRESTDKQLREVLGEEKAQKFQEMQRQGGGWGRGGGGPGGPGGPFFGGPPGGGGNQPPAQR